MLSKSTILEWITQDKIIKITIGVLLSLGTLYGAYRTARSVEYNDLIVEYKEQAKESREALEKCLDRNQSLMFENQSLLQSRRDITAMQFDSPMARWMKIQPTPNSQPVMRYVNDAYKNTYLIPFGKSVSAYEGKTDIEFWGEEIGGSYLEEDMRVITTGRAIDEMSLDPFTKRKTLRVIKYPIRLPNGEIIGVAGEAITPFKNKK